MSRDIPLERIGTTFRLQAMPNGRAKYPVTCFSGVDGSRLFIEEVNLANSKQREALVAALPKPERDELLALAMELAHDVAEHQQRTMAKSRSTEVPASDASWPDPVDAGVLFTELCRHIRDYVVLLSHELTAVTVWVFHTYVTDVTDYTPYLWPHSPVRACGKSTLLELLYHLAHRAQLTGGITAGALARRIDRLSPTMLLDELDTRLHGDGGEALRGILNTGFHRLGTYTVCQGDANEDRDFKTYCPKVLAGIGRLWDTVMSRSIPIRMERANREELTQVKKMRGDRIHAQCAPFRRKLLRWAEDTRETLRDIEPDVPMELDGRLTDIWRPLLAIAESINDDVALRVRDAARSLYRKTETEGDHSLLLLADVRDLFAAEGQPAALFTATLLTKLLGHEDRPWPEFKRGDRAMTGRDIARLLGKFNVKPKTVRIGGETAKGYKFDDLAPVFVRYLPDEREKAGAPSSQPSQTSQTAEPAASDPVATGVTDQRKSPSRTLSGGPTIETFDDPRYWAAIDAELHRAGLAGDAQS
jgi:hypothetical protein